jgi:hypothetical protein
MVREAAVNHKYGKIAGLLLIALFVVFFPYILDKNTISIIIGLIAVTENCAVASLAKCER